MIHRQRLYFILPHLQVCKQLVIELEEAGLEEQYIHIMADESVDLKNLPVAHINDTTEITRGLEWGAGIGGVAGFLAGQLVINFSPEELMLGNTLILLITTLSGVGFGGLMSALMGANQPKHELENIELRLRHGEIVLMLDIPNHRIQMTEEMIKRLHPDITINLLTDGEVSAL